MNPLIGSILEDVRTACDLDSTDSGFDGQLIPLINSQLMIAHEFGVGYEGFNIVNDQQTWEDLLGEDGGSLSAMKSWLGLSVKLMFDPPDNGTVFKAFQDQIARYEWTLNSKSERHKIVKKYVPEHAEDYD